MSFARGSYALRFEQKALQAASAESSPRTSSSTPLSARGLARRLGGGRDGSSESGQFSFADELAQAVHGEFLGRYLGYCSEKNIRPLAEVLRVLQEIGEGEEVTFSLSASKPTPEDIECLMHAIPKLDALVRFVVDRYLLGPQSACYIASFLKPSSCIRALVLDDCNIQDEGGVAIGQALAANPVLSYLDLTSNKLESQTAYSIAAALQHNGNTHLRVLLVGNNRFYDKGAIALCAALQSNSTLSTLALNNNHLGHRSGVAVLQLLDHNGVLSSIDIAYNSMPESQMESINSILRERCKVLTGGSRNPFFPSSSSSTSSSTGKKAAKSRSSASMKSSTPAEKITSSSSHDPTSHAFFISAPAGDESFSNASYADSPPRRISLRASDQHDDSAFENHVGYRSSIAHDQLTERSEMKLTDLGVSTLSSFSVDESSSVPHITHSDLVHRCGELVELDVVDKEKIDAMVDLFHMTVQRMNQYSNALQQADDRIQSNRNTTQLLIDRLRVVTNERDQLEHAYRRRVEELEVTGTALARTEAQLRSVQDSEESLRASREALEKAIDDMRADFTKISPQQIVEHSSFLEEQVTELSQLLEQSNKELERVSGLWTSQVEETDTVLRRLQKSQVEIEQWKKRHSQLQTDYDRFVDENKKERDNREERMESFRLRVSQLTSQMSKKDQDYADLKSEWDSIEERHKNELARIQNRIAVAEKEAEKASQERSIYEEENKSIQAELSSLKSKVEDLESSLSSVRTTLEEKESLLEVERSEHTAARDRISSLEEELASVLTERDSLSQNLADTNADLNLRKQEIDDLHDLMERTVQQAEQSSSMLYKLEADRQKESQEFLSTIATLNNELSLARRKSETIEIDIKKRDTRIQDLEDQCIELSQLITSGQAELESRVNAYNEERQRADMTLERSRRLEQELHRLSVEKNNMEEKADEIKTLWNRDRERSEELERIVAQKEGELNKWRARFRELERDQSLFNERFQQLESERDEVASSLEDSRGSIQSLRREKEALVSRCSELDELLKLSDQCFSSLEEEKGKLETKYEDRIRALQNQLEASRRELAESVSVLEKHGCLSVSEE